MMIELTRNELNALAAVAIHTACTKAKLSDMPESDVATLLDMNRSAIRLLESSTITPTELKNLGLNMLMQGVQNAQ
jgi:chromosome segregation and condensation protein ScpB